MLPLCANRDATLVAGHENGCMKQDGIAGSGVACMADGELAGKLFEHGGCEDLATWPIDLMQWISRPSLPPIPALSLAAMLQSEQAEVSQRWPLRVAIDSKDTALVVELSNMGLQGLLPAFLNFPISPAISGLLRL